MASAPAPSPILLQASNASYLVAAAASSSGFKPPPCPLRTVLLKPIEVCLFCLESCNGSQGAQSKSQSPSRGPQGPMWAALPSPLRSCPSPFVPLLLCSSHTGHPAVARHPAVFPLPAFALAGPSAMKALLHGSLLPSSRSQGSNVAFSCLL